MHHEWLRDGFAISTDPARLDYDVICAFLKTSYWANDRSEERIRRSIGQSLVFGLYHGDSQVGFARVLTDYVVMAFLADVFVIDSHSGQGLGVWLVETVTTLPELQAVRRWLLGTADAHELYRKFGFQEPKPGRLMEKLDLDSDRR